MALEVAKTSPLAPIQAKPCGLERRQKINQMVQRSYAKTLLAMREAHFKTYFEMQKGLKEDQEGICLTRVFSSFSPCPLRLTMIGLCSQPSDSSNSLEIFQGLQKECDDLYKKYQKLDSNIKQQLVDDLIEGTASEEIQFHYELDSLLKKIEERHAKKMPILLHIFQKSVLKEKQLLDLRKEVLSKQRLLEENPSKMESLPTNVLLVRVISSPLISGDFKKFNSTIFIKYIDALKELKIKYDSLDESSKYLLRINFQAGVFFSKHNDPIAQEVRVGIETIIDKLTSQEAASTLFKA